MAQKVAIVADGGFLRIKLKGKSKKFPDANDIERHCRSLLSDPRFKNDILFRIFYYDCLPLDGKIQNPIDGSTQDLLVNSAVSHNQKVIDNLRLKEDFAVRLGTLVNRGWKMGSAFLHQLPPPTPGQPRASVNLQAGGLVPNIQQKGVDMKIGLDVTLLATKRLVDKVIMITGDSDFIPVMKLARREGLKVYLNPMRHPVHVTLKEHADGLL